MCNAYSCLLTRDGKVLWAAGVDSHTDLIERFKLDDAKPPLDAGFVRLESNPKEGYLWPEKGWNPPKVDQSETPKWFSEKMLLKVEPAREAWMKEVYAKLNLEEARHPVHPADMEPPTLIGEAQLALLKEWASVRASVGGSVWASVGASVWDSVGASVGGSVRASVGGSVRASVGGSVWASVGASVRASVGASVWGSVRDSVGASVGASAGAYMGSLFFNIKEWRHTEKVMGIPKGEYPFRSAVALWKQGLVPVKMEGKKWALYHPVRDKPAVKLWEGEV